MGGVSSSNKLRLDIGNKINQISNAECVNTQVLSSQIKSNIINSIISGDVNISQAQMINGVSCTLRSTISNELINNIIGNQDANAEDTEDALTGLGRSLGSLTPWGAAVNMAEAFRVVRADNQVSVKMINEITQQINAICQNRQQNVDAPITSSVVDSTIKGNLNINQEQEISQTSCMIENGIRNITRNDLEFDQDATAKREKSMGLFGALIGIVFIIIIIVMLTSVTGGIPSGGSGSSSS